MARRVPLRSLRQISEINLTPLMDLTFILLITFIITFPLIEQGIPIALPRGDAAELTPDSARTISITRDGSLHLDDLPISMDMLRGQLELAAESDPDVMVMVRADEALRYGAVVEVLRTLRIAKITRMALVTQAEGDSP